MSTLNPPSHLKLPIVSHTNTKKITFNLTGNGISECNLTATILPNNSSYVHLVPAPSAGSLLKLTLGSMVTVEDIPAIIQALQAVKVYADSFQTREETE